MGSFSEQPQKFWCSVRFSIAVLGFFGILNLYALRTNLSVAIVCMLNHTAIHELAASTENPQSVDPNKSVAMTNLHDEVCSPNDHNATAAAMEDGDFVWTKQQKGLSLGAFYWGYLATQFAGGLLSEKYGARRVIGYSMLICSLLTILTPLAAQAHFAALMLDRILIGVFEGFVYPSTHALWSNWAPPMERSKLVGFTLAGGQIGNALAFPYTAILCEYAGWPSVFYSMGAITLLWCIAWLMLSSDRPANHKRISPDEKLYIQRSLQGQTGSKKTSIRNMPWKAIATSPAVWAIIVGHTSANIGTYLMLTSLPLFMKEVLHFDIKSNGLLSALPYLLYWLVINLAGFTSDFIRKRKLLRTGQVRKLMTFIALGGQAAFFMAAAYCECGQEYLAVAFVTIAQGISGCQYSGTMINSVDIAPKFAGTLFGITNTFGTMPGIVAPAMVAALTPNGGREEWRMVFWISSAILLFGSCFYGVFGSGDLQPWAADSGDEDDLKNGAVAEEMLSLTDKKEKLPG